MRSALLPPHWAHSLHKPHATDRSWGSGWAPGWLSPCERRSVVLTLGEGKSPSLHDVQCAQCPSQAFLVLTGCMREESGHRHPAPGGGQCITPQSGPVLGGMAPHPPTISSRERSLKFIYSLLLFLENSSPSSRSQLP